jgi:hypothetical protein
VHILEFIVLYQNGPHILAHSKPLLSSTFANLKYPAIPRTFKYFNLSNNESKIVEARLLQRILRSSHLPQTSFQSWLQISPRTHNSYPLIHPPGSFLFHAKRVQVSMFWFSWYMTKRGSQCHRRPEEQRLSARQRLSIVFCRSSDVLNYFGRFLSGLLKIVEYFPVLVGLWWGSSGYDGCGGLNPWWSGAQGAGGGTDLIFFPIWFCCGEYGS